MIFDFSKIQRGQLWLEIFILSQRRFSISLRIPGRHTSTLLSECLQMAKNARARRVSSDFQTESPHEYLSSGHFLDSIVLRLMRSLCSTVHK